MKKLSSLLCLLFMAVSMLARGCKADWVTAAGDGRNYIDDIDL